MTLAVSYRAYRVWQRNRDAFLRQWLTETGGVVIEPLIILAAIGYGLGTYLPPIDGMRYVEFIAPGIIASYAMFHASYECTYGAYLRVETHRIFDGIIATPLSVEDATLGEIIWGGTRSIMTGAAVLAAVAIFGLIDSPLAVLTLPMSILVGIMFASMAMTLTAVAPSINVLSNFFTLFVTPMFFFSGTFFPLDQLPQALQTLAWVLPLTSATHIMRGLVQGEMTITMLGALAIILLFTIVFLYSALVLMRRRLIK